MKAKSIKTLSLLGLVSLLPVLPTDLRAQDFNSPPANAPAESPSGNSGSDLSSFLSTFYTDGQKIKPKTTWLQSIDVSPPVYCSSLKEDTTVTFKAPGMTTVYALCWQQFVPNDCSPWGHVTDVAPGLQLGSDGSGNFVFHANQFLNCAINLRIFAKNGGGNQDYCELQLFNRGGVVLNQGSARVWGYTYTA